MSNFKQFCIKCTQCGGVTSKAYARTHNGLCKCCVTGDSGKPRKESLEEYRNRICIDHGYAAYAREEGWYDIPGE